MTTFCFLGKLLPLKQSLVNKQESTVILMFHKGVNLSGACVRQLPQAQLGGQESDDKITLCSIFNYSFVCVSVGMCASHHRPPLWLQVFGRTAALMGSTLPPATPRSVWSARSAWQSTASHREGSRSDSPHYHKQHQCHQKPSGFLSSREIKVLIPYRGWSGWVRGRRQRNTSFHDTESS